MTAGNEQDLVRLLHGELPPGQARELRERMEREPKLAAAYRRIERTWNALSLPPAAPVPPGFSARVMAHARSQGPAGGLSWASAPAWVRATAAAALIAGAAAGVGVGRSWPAAETRTAADSSSASAATTVSSLSGSEYSLADGYWDVVEDTTSASTGAAGTEVQR